MLLCRLGRRGLLVGAWVDGVWVDGVWVDGVWVTGILCSGGLACVAARLPTAFSCWAFIFKAESSLLSRKSSRISARCDSMVAPCSTISMVIRP